MLISAYTQLVTKPTALEFSLASVIYYTNAFTYSVEYALWNNEEQL